MTKITCKIDLNNYFIHNFRIIAIKQCWLDFGTAGESNLSFNTT